MEIKGRPTPPPEASADFRAGYWEGAVENLELCLMEFAYHALQGYGETMAHSLIKMHLPPYLQEGIWQDYRAWALKAKENLGR